MTITTLASYLEQLERMSARNEITALLSTVYKESTPDEARIISYLTLGRLAPKFEGLEFQMAAKSMVRVLATAYHEQEQHVQSLFKEKGDLGIVAEQLSKQHSKKDYYASPPLLQIYDQLLEIAQDEGVGSVERKIRGFADLLEHLDPLSVRYITRMPMGALRLGFSDMTILDALSWMEKGDKSLRKEIEYAFNVSADIGLIACEFKRKGPSGIRHLSLAAGIPVRPQQAERLPSSEDIINKLGSAAVEYKLDGFRAQIHVVSGDQSFAIGYKQKTQLLLGPNQLNRKVMVFSRSLENTTHMFPEIVEEIRKLNVKSVILDGEAIGYDPVTRNHLPFQETIQRKRKHGIDEIAKQIPLRYYAFDILLLDGVSLLSEPFSVRRKKLEQLIAANHSRISEKTITIAEQTMVETPEALTSLFEESVARGYEGIMAKKLDESYQAGARNFTWVKFKHTGEGKLADTLDCVVMGMYRGQGKRAGFGIGAFLVGVPYSSPKSNTTYKTIAKVGTGLSDEQWKHMRQLCEKNAVKMKPKEYEVPKELAVDVWVAPEIVVEIAADEITKTPLHSAGLALRFPRLMSFRADKSAAEASTNKELVKLFKMQ